MTDRTGPEQHRCTICGGEDMPPDILPYCVGGDIKNPIHSWAHARCVFAVMEAKRSDQGPLFPVFHESNDGQ